MADLHCGIIHSNTEVVDRQTIAAHHHKVSQAISVPADFATNAVCDSDCFVGGHPEAIAVGFALCKHFIHLLLICMCPLAPAQPHPTSHIRRRTQGLTFWRCVTSDAGATSVPGRLSMQVLSGNIASVAT